MAAQKLEDVLDSLQALDVLFRQMNVETLVKAGKQGQGAERIPARKFLGATSQL